MVHTRRIEVSTIFQQEKAARPMAWLGGLKLVPYRDNAIRTSIGVEGRRAPVTTCRKTKPSFVVSQHRPNRISGKTSFFRATESTQIFSLAVLLQANQRRPGGYVPSQKIRVSKFCVGLAVL